MRSHGSRSDLILLPPPGGQKYLFCLDAFVNGLHAQASLLWGHWDEQRYRAERERLEGMRKELQDAEGPARVEPKLSGLLSAWDSGDAVTRRELLATLFSHIHVCHGRVVGYTPRPDRQAQVTRLIDAIVLKLSVNVGGDGFEPTASSV